MKGILLAGGTGSRLYPMTKAVNKHLLPVYDKPMIYYPLSTLMMSGIREILIISTDSGVRTFKNLLGAGEELGLSLEYAVQPKPQGIAQAFIIAEQFLGNSSVSLILGDNIIYANDLHDLLLNSTKLEKGAIVFGYPVKDPERYGVIEFDSAGNPIGLREKPKVPPSNYAVPGMYFYDNEVVNIAKKIKPSLRGELEITSVNQVYLEQNNLKVEKLGRGVAWLDAGTPESLLDASQFVATIEERQGLKIACVEEIAWRMGFIDSQGLRGLADKVGSGKFADYLLNLI